MLFLNNKEIEFILTNIFPKIEKYEIKFLFLKI